MAATMTLAQLRTAVRQRADIVNNTQFFTDAELNSYINQSGFELYDLLVQKFGNDYYVAPPQSITTDGTNYLYSLPSDHYKLIGVDYVSSGGSITVKPFSMSERNRFAAPLGVGYYGPEAYQYKLTGSKIWFTPTPPQNQVFKVWYIPTMTPLALDTDTFDGVSGWTEYIIVDVCIKVKQKEESDARSFIGQKADLIKRIEAAAENRDAGSPKTVSDTLFGDFALNPGVL